ncbi:hypothetical protein LCGC14_0885150 [marine sediment metagenome]|uniref:Uncharacterized protein n=1 Tax=marine sediment metagenome TaxID=412755 RepID=A0A0F9P0U9_9ZZZZ
MDNPILSEKTLFWMVMASLFLCLVAGICFTCIIKKNPNAFKPYRKAKILHLSTVIIVVFATTILGLERILSGEAVAGILGGIVGYVLGSLKNNRNTHIDEE